MTFSHKVRTKFPKLYNILMQRGSRRFFLQMLEKFRGVFSVIVVEFLQKHLKFSQEVKKIRGDLATISLVMRIQNIV